MYNYAREQEISEMHIIRMRMSWDVEVGVTQFYGVLFGPREVQETPCRIILNVFSVGRIEFARCLRSKFISISVSILFSKFGVC